MNNQKPKDCTCPFPWKKFDTVSRHRIGCKANARLSRKYERRALEYEERLYEIKDAYTRALANGREPYLSD